MKSYRRTICKIGFGCILFCIIMSYLDKNESLVEMAEKIKVIISAGVSGFVTFVSPGFAQYLKIFLDRKKDKSQIGVVITDVSEIRKSRRPNDVMEVPLGDKSKYFVYIYAAIKNTGKKELIRLKINDHEYKTSINAKKTIQFRFKVYSKDGKKIRRNHVVKIEFEDEENKLYENRYKLKLIQEKKKALIKRKTL